MQAYDVSSLLLHAAGISGPTQEGEGQQKAFYTRDQSTLKAREAADKAGKEASKAADKAGKEVSKAASKAPIRSASEACMPAAECRWCACSARPSTARIGCQCSCVTAWTASGSTTSGSAYAGPCPNR